MLEKTTRQADRGRSRDKTATGQSLSTPLLVTLALLAATAPFATDLYLPAFPLMARDLSTGAAGVQLSLTTFFIGAALGQLILGPLSDRLGRLPPIVLGSLVCAIASAAAALSPSIQFLVVARFVQGLAASAGMVVGRAIISDLSRNPKQAARAFNLMMTVVGIAPIVAPWLGSLVVNSIGWRGALWMVFGIAVLTLVAVFATVRESLPARTGARADRSIARPGSTMTALLDRRFVGNTLAFGLAFAAMMAYISASPFLFQVIVGLGVRQYGMLFGLVAVIMTATGILSARLSLKVSTRRLLRWGLVGLVTGSLALTLVVFARISPGWTIPPVILAVGSLGLVMGNATSAALAAVPNAVGAGSAVLGALQFGLGALVAPLVGVAGDRSAVPLALVMTIAALLALTAFHWAAKERPAIPSSRTPPSPD